jgi:type I restriction enzyme S subunit
MSKSSFEKLQNYRTALEEQKKIGALLNLIDERISTQIRIIEELKLLRKTLMFKLLTPKDKWLKLSIGDVAHVIGGGTPNTNVEDYWNGNIQWFTPSEIGKEKYVTGSERTLTQKGLDNSSAKLLPQNTILLSTRATIGECSIAKQECCTNQGFQSLIAKNVTPEFLYYLIQTKKKDLLSKASGSTFAEISANEVRKIHICIPSTQEEQRAIVQPLSAYDEKIETECKILYLYELQKQYLLGQMFI